MRVRRFNGICWFWSTTRNIGTARLAVFAVSIVFSFGWSISISQDSKREVPLREYPLSEKVTLNDNVLLMVFRTSEHSSSDLVVYVPWDTLSSLDLSSTSLRRGIGEKIARSLPENLILGGVSVRLAMYHQPLMTVTDSFSFGAGIVGRKLFAEDTLLPVMRALIDHNASLASIRILGWMPLDQSLIASRCSGKNAIVPVTLRPGLNVIWYGWLARSGSSVVPPLDSIRAFYSIDLDGKTSPPGFSSIVFHQSDAESRCTTCHSAVGDSDGKTTDQTACLSCHVGMTKQHAVHGPLAAKDCKKCHDTNPRSGYALVYQPKDENQACFSCHTDVLNKTKGKPVVHGPFGGGRCNYCHSPHASPNVFQLRKPVNDLCNSCHENKHEYNHPIVFHPVAWKPDPRNPERELSCISCHDPHASDNKNLLAMAGGYFALCQSCHSK